MTRIGRLLILLVAVGCLQDGALLAQSAEIGHNPLAGAEVGTNGRVSAVVVFDDGNGPALYIGGEFTSVNGTPANRVAKWDGQNWSAVWLRRLVPQIESFPCLGRTETLMTRAKE